MSYISTPVFQAVAFACDRAWVVLVGMAVNGETITVHFNSASGADSVTVPVGSVDTLEHRVFEALSGSANTPRHLYKVGSVSVSDVQIKAWCEAWVNDKPIRTPLERELGVIYG